MLVSFWALWCVPCLKELPHLGRLARETAGRLTVLAVNVDAPRGVAAGARPTCRRSGSVWSCRWTPPATSRATCRWAATMPFVVLYDAAGREVYRHTGYHEGDEVAAARGGAGACSGLGRRRGAAR